MQQFDCEYDTLVQRVRSASSLNYYAGSKEDELRFLGENRARFRYITEQIIEDKQQNILDIGTTPFTCLLTQLFRNAEIHTLDVYDKYKLRAENCGAKFKTCNIATDELPYPDDKFDVIIFTEVLEHIFKEPFEIFDKFAEKLSKDGLLIFGTPNLLRLKNRAEYILGRNPLKLASGGSFFPHVREYSADECQYILEESGFVIENFEYKIFHNFKQFVNWNCFEKFDEAKPRYIPAAGAYYLFCQIFPATKTYLYFTAKAR